MNVLSLFAGIGGLDLALEHVGCTTVAHSEIDPYASKVFEQRFPGSVNLGDITEIDWHGPDIDGLRRNWNMSATRGVGADEGIWFRGRIDIICGGFPCQDISLAGKGAGIDGERSGLWRHFAEAIRVVRPRGVLIENVAALRGRGLDRVLKDLASCGYDAEWDVVPAAAVGAPHLRERVFIIGYGSDTQGGPGSGAGKAAAANTIGEQLREQPWRGSGASGSGTALVAESGEASGDARGNEHQGGRDAFRWSPIEDFRSGYWSAEPSVGRVGYGVPDRVAQLRCLGNAVVPHAALPAARRLMEVLR